jgi:serine/threonine protein kinase
VLYLANENVSKRLYFNRGSIVFAGSDDDEDGLGEVLVREGRIKRSELDFAWRVMQQTGRSLEETLVQMELISPAEIEAQAIRRRKAIIHSSFSWGSGKYRFKELENPVADEMAMKLSTADVILQGIRQIRDLGTIRTLLGDLKGTISRPAEPVLPYEESSLTSPEMVALDIAGNLSADASTAADLVALSPLAEDETLRCLCCLVSVGALEIQQPPSPPASAKDLASHESSSESPDNLPNRLGRYEIQKVLGRGSMGTVFLARDPAIERVVAIKLIQAATFLTAPEQERYRNRFRREAKAAGKLIHPGIVTVFDVGHADQESPFIVMEYVDGATLAAVIQDKELRVDETVSIAHEILDALGYAHSFGIVHRDIKLANIMVTPGLHPKIMDFGIAHVVGTQLTPTEQGMGSPNYMAPEQLSKATIDQRTDLFAFGVVLYRLLTGKLPFTGDSFAAAAHAILYEQPESPDRINPDVSQALAQVALRCLAKDPAKRFASAEEVRQALASDALDRAHATLEAGGAFTGSPPLPRPPAGRVGRVHPDMDLHDATAPEESDRTRPLGTLGTPAPPTQKPQRTKRGRLLFAAVAAPVILGLIALVFVLAPGDLPVEPSPEQANNAPLEEQPGEAAPESAVADRQPSPAYAHLSDSELYFTARQDFENGALEESKARLEELVRRDAEFAGASQLLAHVEQTREADAVAIESPEKLTDSTRPAVPSDARRNAETEPAFQREVHEPSATNERTEDTATSSEPELFYDATLAREQGDFETSKARLEELLQRNPVFGGAADLLVEVDDEIWRQTLPVTFEARHRHRIGGCTGTLRLGAGQILFQSDSHDWRWELDAIRIMERTDDGGFLLETFEKDILGMGKPKRYRFDLSQPLDSETWTRYERLAKRESLSEGSSNADSQVDFQDDATSPIR